MRSSPRLVAPASTVARIVARFECTRLERRSVNASRKPVREFTSHRRSVIRMRGMSASIARSRRSPAGGVTASCGVMRRRAFSRRTPSSRPRASFVPTAPRRSCSRLASIGEPDRGVGLDPAFGEHMPGFVRRRQIGVEAAIVATAFDPHVAGAKPVAQRRDHGGLVGTPGALPVGRDHRSPLPARERHRHNVRQIASAGPVQLTEQFHCRVQAPARGGSVKLEGLQERGGEPSKLHVSSCG